MPKSFAGWKYALIAVVLSVGFVLALPNWFGKSPAVQMQFAESVGEQAVAETLVHEVNKTLAEAGLAATRWQTSGRGVNLYFDATDTQLQAKDLLARRYPEAAVAVNLLSNAPAWMEARGLDPMNLGLDLRGGVSFLLQVDSNELFERKSTELLDTTLAQLQEKDLPHAGSEAAPEGGAILWFADTDARDNALNALAPFLPPEVTALNVEKDGQTGAHLKYSEAGIAQLKRRAAEQNRIRMAGRVNTLGVAEPAIQVVGDDRILIQLPGIQDVTQAKELLGSTATLEFYLVDDQADVAKAVRDKRAPFGSKLAYFEDGTPIVLKRRVIMSGDHIIDASAGYGQDSPGPQVSVVLDSAGGAQMTQITRDNLKKPMATMYVEYIPVERLNAQGEVETVVEKRETVVNSATIQSQFGSNFQITGVTPIQRAQKLAATLRAGSLVAPVYIIEERTIGPSAGQKNIDQGVNAALLGLAFIALFMMVYYRRLGVFAMVALAGNGILIVGLMSLLGATLTLPGIAGIVLTLGMAVDANVLIYERIREEMATGLAVREAVRAGFDNALSTIVDANITTLIVSVLLFSFGAGPIKGFAVTLSIGVLTSMFTAIYVTRALIEFFLLRRAQPTLKM
ncbi:MAG: protein translocase subunit SecD [Cardiobacteriaceae bacterium]|nr:protein translocase subunit SecD [Cardiobacteriaceae bacterium]